VLDAASANFVVYPKVTSIFHNPSKRHMKKDYHLLGGLPLIFHPKASNFSNYFEKTTFKHFFVRNLWVLVIPNFKNGFRYDCYNSAYR
jgi:hypothetical protein